MTILDHHETVWSDRQMVPGQAKQEIFALSLHANKDTMSIIEAKICKAVTLLKLLKFN